ncbi:hypothetical protein [Lentibacillus salinarum]|uniref:Yip1 domain-containing protein n=1 Tax=Lentibacillus salinarum TaxID=446820 RepID=A0ABW3ZVI5_9BACI
MLECPKCNTQQESGKFCGVCGSALEPATGDANEGTATAQEGSVSADGYQQAAADAHGSVQHQAQANQTADTIKNGLSQYWHYVLNLLRNPTMAFHTSSGHILNAVITLVIFALASSLSVYFLANAMASSMFGGMMESSVPFFSLTFQLLFIAVVFLALAFASALMMTKAAKNQDSAKTLLTQFGSLAVPFVALNVVAIVAGIAGSTVFTMLLLGVSYSLLLYFVPVLFVYEKANLVSNTGQKVYLSLSAALIMAVLTFLTSGMILSDMIDKIGRSLSFL